MPSHRKDPRYQADIVVRYELASEFVEEYASNLSAGGLYVPDWGDAQPNDELVVAIELPGSGAFRVLARVVHVVDSERAAASGSRAGTGLQIIRRPEGFDAALAAHLKRLQRRSDRVVLVGSPDLRKALASAGFATREAPSPNDLRDVVSAEPSFVALVLSEGDAAAYSRIPGAFELIRICSGVEELDDLVRYLDAAEFAVPRPRDEGEQDRREGHHLGSAIIHYNEPIVGIDLGTSFTSIAVVLGNQIVPLHDKPTQHSIASAVAFPNGREVVLGAQAKEHMLVAPEHTIVSPKRLLGRKFRDTNVQGLLNQMPCKTVEGPDGTVIVEMRGEPYAIPQICSFLISRARELAEEELGQKVRRAVFTAPVGYEHEQKQALARAAQLAQLEVLEIIDEPSAAALANRSTRQFEGTVAIYDFGGGTFDVSIVDVRGNRFNVLGTSGDLWLGGDDFDNVLSNAIADTLWKRTDVDVRNLAVEFQQLTFAAERTKRALSTARAAPLVIPNYLRTSDGMRDLRVSITRNDFAKLSSPIVNQSMDVFRHGLEMAEVKPEDLSSIFLAGGTTHIPHVQRALVDQMGVPLYTGVPPEYAPAIGACIYAEQLVRRGRR